MVSIARARSQMTVGYRKTNRYHRMPTRQREIGFNSACGPVFPSIKRDSRKADSAGAQTASMFNGELPATGA